MESHIWNHALSSEILWQPIYGWKKHDNGKDKGCSGLQLLLTKPTFTIHPSIAITTTNRGRSLERRVSGFNSWCLCTGCRQGDKGLLKICWKNDGWLRHGEGYRVDWNNMFEGVFFGWFWTKNLNWVVGRSNFHSCRVDEAKMSQTAWRDDTTVDMSAAFCLWQHAKGKTHEQLVRIPLRSIHVWWGLLYSPDVSNDLFHSPTC